MRKCQVKQIWISHKGVQSHDVKYHHISDWILEAIPWYWKYTVKKSNKNVASKDLILHCELFKYIPTCFMFFYVF